MADPNKAKTPSPVQPEGGAESLIERLRQLESENEALRLELWRHRRKPSGIAGYGLLILGAVSLSSSIIYSSIIPAFIGLGLAFWGALLLYIKPTRYVKADLLDSTAISTLTAIDRVTTELNYEGKGIYLPPRYLKEIKGGTVFIPSNKEITIPPVEEVTEEKVFLKNPNGICLTPAGLGLTNLYEDELGTDFARVDFNYLQNNMPKLFIENLEIAENLELSMEGSTIHVKIVGSIYADFCRELRKTTPNICSSFGCPLCSSIALALARTTGKPITIEKTEQSEDGKTIETHCQIIEK